MVKALKQSGGRARGQYTRYTATVVSQVCEDLAAGKTWEQIGETPGRPSYSTMFKWRKLHPAFAEAADAARAYGADVCADRALTVAEQATKETVQQAKLHVDTLMQRAAFLAPQRWSAKAAAPAKPEPVEVVFRVRHFQRMTGPDGIDFLREVKPEGDA